jgi:hypothetical protein
MSASEKLMLEKNTAKNFINKLLEDAATRLKNKKLEKEVLFQNKRIKKFLNASNK